MTLLFSVVWGLAAGWLGMYLLEEGNTLLAYVALAFASVCGYYALSNLVAILRSFGGPEVKCAKCGATERLRDLNIRRDSKLYAVEIVRGDGSKYGALVCFFCEHWTELLREADGSYQNLGFAQVDKKIYQLAITYAEARNHNSSLKKIKALAIGRQLRKEARGKLPIRELSVIGLCIGLIGLLGYFSSRPTTEIKGAEPNQGRTTPDISNLLKPFRPWLPPSNESAEAGTTSKPKELSLNQRADTPDVASLYADRSPELEVDDEASAFSSTGTGKQCGDESEDWDQCFGRFVYADQDVFEGLWIDNNPYWGSMEFCYEDEAKGSYEGFFVTVDAELRYHGKAIYTFADGSRQIIRCDEAINPSDCERLTD